MTDSRSLPESIAEFCSDRRRPLGLLVGILLLLLAGCAADPIAPPTECVTEIEITATTRSVLDHRYKPDAKPGAQLCVKGKK